MVGRSLVLLLIRELLLRGWGWLESGGAEGLAPDMDEVDGVLLGVG